MTARWRLLAAIFLGVLALAFAAAWIWWILRPPTPGPLRLTKTSFSALPGWSTSDPSAALSSFLRSCAVLTKET
ncbi:MAG: hypothetical protein KGI68_13675, partial [Alphaproteobacteria bacterium]|nr:hypothetical protein [Alphaproteobacteria bacterium]